MSDHAKTPFQDPLPPRPDVLCFEAPGPPVCIAARKTRVDF